MKWFVQWQCSTCFLFAVCLKKTWTLYTALFTIHWNWKHLCSYAYVYFISSSPSAEHLKQLIWSKIVKLGGKEYQCADCGIVRGQVSGDWRQCSSLIGPRATWRPWRTTWRRGTWPGWRSTPAPTARRSAPPATSSACTSANTTTTSRVLQLWHCSVFREGTFF